MRGVLFVFITLALCFAGWKALDKRERKGIKKAARWSALPMVGAALCVFGLLFFALNFNGKLL